jgi:hypothetical protein
MDHREHNRRRRKGEKEAALVALIDTLATLPPGARPELLNAVLMREPHLRKFVNAMREPWQTQLVKKTGALMDDMKTLLRRHHEQLRADGMLESQQEDDDDKPIPNDVRADLCRYFNLCWIIEKIEYITCIPLGTKSKNTAVILKKLNAHRKRVHKKLQEGGYL